MILSREELIELTHKKRNGAQKRELDALGIPAKPRSDGSLIVFWEDVRATHNPQPVRREPVLRLAG